MPVIRKKDTFAAEINADVAELVDAQDLGSCALKAWGFESLHPHWEDGAVLKSDLNGNADFYFE